VGRASLFEFRSRVDRWTLIVDRSTVIVDRWTLIVDRSTVIVDRWTLIVDRRRRVSGAP